MEELTPSQIVLKFRSQEWLAGDGVGFQAGEGFWINLASVRVQRQALATLEPDVAPAVCAYASRVSHWACGGPRGVLEAFPPHARRRSWAELVGSTIFVCRPVGATPLQLLDVYERFLEDVTRKKDYPQMQLAYYLAAMRPFWSSRSLTSLALNATNHVCSALYVEHVQNAGVPAFLSEEPSGEPCVPAYYFPARLLVTPRMETLCCARITGGDR